MLLESHPLGDEAALEGHLATVDLLLDLNVVLTALDLGLDQLATGTDGVHEVSLEQVVEGVEVEALVEKLEVDLLGEAHEAHSLILDLGYECLVALVLGRDQLGDKVLAISLSDGLRLRIEHISEIIMTLLLGPSDLNKRQHIQAG